jgi:hypothetical protein
MENKYWQSGDLTYGGWGSNFAAMMPLLYNKFIAHASGATKFNYLYKDVLRSQPAAFLLEFNAKVGRDTNWSNNGLQVSHGGKWKAGADGKNWLGLQSMIIRDIALGNADVIDGQWWQKPGTAIPLKKVKTGSWTHFLINDLGLDVATGKFGSGKQEAIWTALVFDATMAIADSGKGQKIDVTDH